MKIRTAAKESVGPLIRRVVQDTDRSFGGLLQGEHQFLFGNRSIVAQPIDIVRWLSEHVPAAQDVLHIRNIIVNAIAGSEARLSGSGFIALLTAMDLMGQLHEPKAFEQKLKSISESTKKMLESSRRCSTQEAIEIIRAYDNDKTLYVTKTAIDSCSANASISIDTVPSQTSIRQVEGHIFPAQVPEVFLASARISNRRPLNGPRVIVVDGVVERMSEIEGVIGGSHAAQEPLILFARGFAADVQNTLGKNYSLGHLLAIPLVVPYDELGANLLGDISIVCGADLVSSFKGDLISARSWHDLRQIDQAIITSTNVTLVNPGSTVAIKQRRKHLGDKRKSCAQLEEMIVDRRLQCLMGQGVQIEVGSDTGDLSGIYRDRIASHIRIFRACARHGIVDLSSVGENSMTAYHKSALGRLNQIPAAALAVGVKSGIACAKSMQNLGGLVYGNK